MSAGVMERIQGPSIMHDADSIRVWARDRAAAAPPLSQQQSLRLRGLFSGGRSK